LNINLEQINSFNNMNLNEKSENKIWKAAIYARISKEDGDKDESDSIANQKELIKSFIRNKSDIIPTTEYEDDGYSGVNFERPSFQKMIEDIRAGLINCVIVKDLSRLGRNYIETGKMLERFFPFMGVRFIAINDSYDSNSHTDNMILPFVNLVNDSYSADTSRKIRTMFEVKRKKGEFIGPFAAYGYMRDPNVKNKLIIDEAVAPIIRDIFKWKIEGMSQQGIGNKLDSMGVMSPLEYKKHCGLNYTSAFQTKYKGKWSAVAIGRILRNDLYIGVLTQGKITTPNHKIKKRIIKPQDEWVRIENSHEAIVSEETFILVRELLKKDTTVPPNRDSVYPFSGMLTCNDCGQSLIRKTVPSGNKKYIYHVCSTNKNKQGCTSHMISDKALYSAVLETLKLHIGKCIEISQILEVVNELPLNQLDVQKLQKQIIDKEIEIKKLNERKLKLHEDYSDGDVSKEDYSAFNDIYTNQAVEANQAITKLQQELDDILNNRTKKNSWIDNFKKHKNIKELSRGVIVQLIERITVFENGKIEVTPRYQANFEDAVRYIKSLSDEEKLVI